MTTYDRIAQQYADARTEFREKELVDRLLAMAKPGTHLLDLGCGCGRPITRYLLDRGHRVTGLDASREMLRLAQKECPEADWVHADMTEADLTGPYGGIVAWDSVFHVKRELHEGLFGSLYAWLEPGAALLLSIGGSEWEGTSPMFGVDFFYSGFSPPVTLSLLRSRGFEILLAEIDDPSSRGHMAVLCRKPVR